MPPGTECQSHHETLHVGAWVVQRPMNRLLSAGKCVKLEPKWMEVLVFLADHPGEVVSREALFSAVWPGVVVGDESLTQVVARLRKALGDSGGYIQTIPKRGYRLVAPVSRDLAASLPVRGRQWGHAVAAGWVLSALFLAAAVTSSITTRSASPDTDVTTQPTISVLPFVPLGDDEASTLLARAIAADLAMDLSKVAGLSVIDVMNPATTRDQRYLVSGTIQRSEKRLRLQVRLVDRDTGIPVWSERFDREPADLFAIQEELVGQLLRALPAKVSEAELRRAARRHTRNQEAYEFFQRGQAALMVRSKNENEAARGMFRRAIALDPAFARAYAWLALTYTADYRNQWTEDGVAALDRAFELARTARQINPDVRETYFVIALVHRDRHQEAQAIEALETAIRLYPSYADAYALMGSVKAYMGRPAEAVPLLRTALRLNPEAASFYFLNLGRCYYALGDLEQARLNFEQALSRNAASLDGHVYMAVVHAAAGDQASASWEAEEIRALRPGFTGASWLKTHPLSDASHKTRLTDALAALGL